MAAPVEFTPERHEIEEVKVYRVRRIVTTQAADSSDRRTMQSVMSPDFDTLEAAQGWMKAHGLG